MLIAFQFTGLKKNFYPGTVTSVKQSNLPKLNIAYSDGNKETSNIVINLVLQQ